MMPPFSLLLSEAQPVLPARTSAPSESAPSDRTVVRIAVLLDRLRERVYSLGAAVSDPMGTTRMAPQRIPASIVRGSGATLETAGNPHAAFSFHRWNGLRCDSRHDGKARTSSARWSPRTSRPNRFGRPIATRFPPEPNGFPHIGHAKSICLNFGIAREFGGRCNLRFDDTNPSTEDIKYVEAIKNDISWLGFEWDGGALRQRLLRAAVRVRRAAGRRRERRTSTRRRRRRSARIAAR